MATYHNQLIKKLLFLPLLFLLLIVSCKKQTDFYDELGKGSYLTFVSGSSLLNAVDANASVKLVVNSTGTSVASVNVYVSATPTLNQTQWTLIKNVPFTGETTLSVTNSEIATALGLTPGALPPGSVFNLYNEVVASDGHKFSSANTSGADLENQVAFNTALRWTATVICPFDAATIAGTYTVVRDDWQDWVAGEQVHVSAGPGANEINLSEVWPNAAFANIVSPLVITVDPASGMVTIPTNLTFGNYGAFTAVAQGGNGFVFSCTGRIDLNVRLSAPPFGDQGFNRLILQK